MRRPPTIAALLATASLAVPAAALAQGAGDNQYQDPFGGGSSSGGGSVSTGSNSGSSSGSSSGSGTSGSSSGSSSSGSGLSQSPNLGTSTTSGSATSSSSTATSSSTAATGSATNRLPNTGSDPRLLALAGLALLLSGAGLRLRTADERF